MAVERVDEQFRAYELPAPGSTLAERRAAASGTKWQEEAALVEAASRATHEGHMLGIEHGALSESSIHVDGQAVAVSGMGLTKGAALPPDANTVAPEVLAGGAPTAKSDVYSLGRTLERGMAGDAAAVPAGLRRLITSATSSLPAERPASALAFANEIRKTGGSSLPTYSLAALGGSAGGRALAGSLAKRSGATPRGAVGTDDVATGVVGKIGATGAAAVGGAALLGAKGPGAASAGAVDEAVGEPKRRRKGGALLAGAALVGVAGLGLWAATDDNDGTVVRGSTGTTAVESAAEEEPAVATAADAEVADEEAGTTGDVAASEESAEDDQAGEPAAVEEAADANADAEAAETAETEQAEDTDQAEGSDGTEVAGAAMAAATLSAADAAGSFEILHAIPGVPVDAYLDGELAAAGFEPGMVAGPVAVDQALETLTLLPAIDSPPAALGERTDDPVLEVPLADAEAGTYVAYLDGDSPTVAAVPNDLSSTPPGQGRVSIRQFSPAVASITIDGEVVDVPPAPDGGASLDLTAGTYSVQALDSDDGVLFDESLSVQDGVLSTLFIRAADDGEGAVLALRSVDGLASAPTGIPSGTGGLLGDDAPEGLVPGVVVMTLLAGAGWAVQRRREPLHE